MTLCPNALISTPLHAAIFLQLQKKRNKTKKSIIKILRTLKSYATLQRTQKTYMLKTTIQY